jgi:hypothetical protein
MTEHSLITPPPELFAEWLAEAKRLHPRESTGFIAGEVAKLAYRAGADQELEACCEWLVAEPWFKYEHEAVEDLRAARRPKPPSLKEQALQELDKVDMLWATEEFGQETLNSLDTIRRAIESIPDPS